MSGAVTGSPADLALAGGPVPGDLVVVIGEAPVPDGADPSRCVRLLDAADRPGGSADVAAPPRPSAAERLVATAGEGLWRRAPWPAADDLLSAPPPAAGAPVLVVDPTDASGLSAELAARDVPAQRAERLDPERLLAASVVLFAGAPGDPLPVHAPAVLAAGRVLIVPRAEPAFGLLPATDHLAYDDNAAAAQYADAAYAYPDAFESIRAMGRAAVRAHLASGVYARWAVDLDLGL